MNKKNRSQRFLLRIVILLVLVFVFFKVAYFSSSQIPTLIPSHVSSPKIPCYLTDQSFCSTRNLFQQFMQSQSYSDLIQNQQSSSLLCTGIEKKYSACNGVNAGVVNAFAIAYAPSNVDMVTRNEYIPLLQQSLPLHAALIYRGSVEDHGEAIMVFQSNQKPIVLYFKKNSSWKFIYPVFFLQPQHSMQVSNDLLHLVDSL